MSYILDALKESQKQRDDGRVPSLKTVHAPPDSADLPRERHYGRVGLAAVLVLAAGIGGWWWSSRPDQPTAGLAGQPPLPANPGVALVPVEPLPVSEEATPAPRHEEPETRTAAEKTAADKVAETAGTVTDNRPLAAEEVTRAGSDMIDDIEPVPADETVVAARETAEAPVPAKRAAAASEPAQPAESDDEAAIEGEEAGAAEVGAGQGRQIASAEPLATTSADVEAAPAAPAGPAPMNIHSLPYDVQRALPDLRFTVHLYSPNPERRMVKLSGLMRREGDSLGNGLVLDEITPAGVVFVYRDYRFLVPVN